MIQILLGELIGTATSNKSGLMSPKLYCAIPNSYVVNGATELKGKYVKIISVNDWNGSIINVKVSNYGNGSYFYIILCLATNNIGRWVSGKLIAGNISGFSFYRVDKSIYMFIPDSIPDLYVTLDASMGNVSYGEEYENTIDLSNPITISWHNSLSTLDLGGLIGVTTPTKDGLMPKNQVCRNIAKINNLHCRLKCNISSPGEWVNGFLYVGSTSGSVSTIAVSVMIWNETKVFCKLINGVKGYISSISYIQETNSISLFVEMAQYANILFAPMTQLYSSL